MTNTTLRLCAVLLTMIASVLFFLQLFLKEKGTVWHGARGIGIFVLSAISILLNILVRFKSGGIIWDTAFKLHIILGSGWLLGIAGSMVTGIILVFQQYPRIVLLLHRYSWRMALFFWILMVLAAPLLHLAR